NIWQTPISSTPDSKPGRYSGRGDVAHGLIAIAYDRNPKQSSRLSSLTIGESGALQLGALKGALAEVRVSDQQIALKSIATNKSKRASR
ncbi:hypothetical protein, partial [Xanthomonas campestris]|uniref:hypothetical protein n=1 Tax=Xanthomonas campestris TaxID=339 RepID=UPI0032E81907